MQKKIIDFEIIENDKNEYLRRNRFMTVFTNFGIQNKILSLQKNKILSLGVDNASGSRCLDFLVKDFFHI